MLDIIDPIVYNTGTFEEVTKPMKKLIFSISFLFLTVLTIQTANAAPTNDQDSGWPECNGWLSAGYDKYACRTKALQRANNLKLYDHGMPLPPSGSKTATHGGTDKQWYDWGGISPKGIHFLSEGTQCGIGPSVCQPKPTPTPTKVPTPTPTKVPTPTPTKTPTPTPTPTVKVCALGDRVVLDSNRNGVQDANESGVANVKVELLNAKNEVIKTTHTDRNGYYFFNNLKCVSYYVRFEKPSGYVFSTQYAGDNKAKDSNANVQSGLSDKINLNGVNRTIDALIYKERTVTPTPTVTVTPTPTVTVTPTKVVTPTPTAAILGVEKLPETGSAWEILGMLSGLTMAAGAGLSELIKRT